MMKLRTVGIIMGVAVSACASMPPPPPNAAPPLTLAERAGIPGVIYSDVIAPAGDAVIASGPVEPGGLLVRFPYRYRHTAVLTEDVVGFSITVSGVQAPRGAPGYYAGTFVGSGGYGPALSGDLWCFLPSVVGGERDNICLLRAGPSVAAIAPTRMNPYLWTLFSPATGSFDYVNAPVFERRRVEIPVDLIIEYRFERWTRVGARLVEYAVGRRVREFDLATDANGEARFRTVAGEMTIARDSAERATLSWSPHIE